jgi:putative endonuclease
MKNSRQSLGKWGESLAADYLTSLGYRIVARNVRTPYGEIDLIAECSYQSIDANERPFLNTLPPNIVTVFVEVKTRRTRGFGAPEESITSRKRAHMIAAARHYIQQKKDGEDLWRIDVIAIEKCKGMVQPHITHFENAISETD